MTHALLTALSLLVLTTPVRAADFDLERWLDEPDTRLVVVEFYADWCIPCQKAAPRWEALRQRYQSQGLKLVVVNIDDKAPSGGCERMPWNPDVALCDPALADTLGVRKLPEAFVWSWQGNLLVDRGAHVEEVERTIQRYLEDTPRVAVAATGPGGESAPEIQRAIEAELGRWGKLAVVPDPAMRQRLAALRKDSHAPDRRDDQRCPLGEEVSANSLLQVERFETALSLQLVDAITGCRRATVSEPIRDGDVQKAVQKAVFTLHAQLKRRPVPMPTKTEASSHSASVSTELATVGTAAPMGSFAWYDSTLGWIFMGLSGTVLVAGAVTHSNEVVSAGAGAVSGRDGTLPIVFYVSSSLLFTAGIITFIVDDGNEDDEPDDDTAQGPSPRLQYIAPTALEGGAGLSAGFRF